MATRQNCTVCIRECKKGHSFCQRRDEYGNIKNGNRFCAIAVDYLFDKPIIHFNGNLKILSLGSWGCNFRCLGCQNVNLSWSVTGENLRYIELEPSEVVGMALKNGCDGICYTYNEPAILLETIENIAPLARQKKLINVFVTNSTLTERSVNKISGYIDAVAVDIKSLKEEFYYNYCGANGIPDITNRILKCIKAFSDNGCHVEVRTNIIPGANDQEENYLGIASWISDNLGLDTPWHITRFFPANKLSHLGQTHVESLLKAQRIGYEQGLKYVHTYTDKGCDCAKEMDLVEIKEGHAMHDCCKNIN